MEPRSLIRRRFHIENHLTGSYVFVCNWKNGPLWNRDVDRPPPSPSTAHSDLSTACPLAPALAIWSLIDQVMPSLRREARKCQTPLHPIRYHVCTAFYRLYTDINRPCMHIYIHLYRIHIVYIPWYI